jgi:alkanesulfonate monooxygenase SsuD/methylene tetrahydromethanopterin reductase-like flavin-dependent oxidoreductase (luciferase family)
MNDLRLGILLWNQATEWPAYEDGARRVEELGYDHLWAWDHLHPIFGDPDQPIFEGWMSLAGWAKVTTRIRLGLLVGAIPFRNPGLVAKMATTLDHISGGRAILGLGGAWFEYEHIAHGIGFGKSVGERLDWLDEACAAIREVVDGGRYTSPPGSHYAFQDLRQEPRPIQPHLPIMIGGAGEKKTLCTVARYGDLWNTRGTPDVLRRKVEVLERHCADVGRDPTTIERTVGCNIFIRDTQAEAQQIFEATMAANKTPMSRVANDPTIWIGAPEQIAEQLIEARDLGFNTAIAEVAAP